MKKANRIGYLPTGRKFLPTILKKLGAAPNVVPDMMTGKKTSTHTMSKQSGASGVKRLSTNVNRGLTVQDLRKGYSFTL